MKLTVDSEYEPPVVSIIVISNNNNKYIKKTIKSIESSTYKNIEIIIVDHSTRKKAPPILKQFKDVKIVRHNNPRLSTTCNIGITSAEGKYILTLNPSDTIEPTYIEKAVFLLESNQNINIIYPSTAVNGEMTFTYTEDAPKNFLTKNQVPIAFVFRKDFMEFINRYSVGGQKFLISGYRKSWYSKSIPELLFNYHNQKKSLFETVKNSHNKAYATNTTTPQASHSPKNINYGTTLMNSIMYEVYARMKEKLSPRTREKLKKLYHCVNQTRTNKPHLGNPFVTLNKNIYRKPKKKKRILFLLNWLTMGGAEYVIYNLIEGIKDKYDVTIVTTSEEDRNEMFDKFYNTIKKIYILKNFLAQEYFADFIVNLVKHNNIKIIVISNAIKGYQFLRKIKTANKNKIINIVHNDEDNIYVEEAIRFDNFIDKHVAVSKKIKGTLTEKYKIDTRKIAVIYNGIDIDEKFNPEKIPPKKKVKRAIGIPKEKRIVTFIGRFSSEKQPLKFIKIAKNIAKLRNDVMFIMIGDGYQRRMIELLIRVHKLSEHIKLFGFREDIEKFLKITDVLVMTSTTEGFPLIPLEAIASGAHVVAPDVGEVNSIIEEGKNGYMVKSNSNEEYTEKINSCLNHNREGIRKSFKEEFTSKAMVKNYVELFEGIKK